MPAGLSHSHPYPPDSTIISISQVPRTKLVRTTDGLESTEGGVLIEEGAKNAARAMMRYMEA